MFDNLSLNKRASIKKQREKSFKSRLRTKREWFISCEIKQSELKW